MNIGTRNNTAHVLSFVLLILVLVIPNLVQATEYYVDQSHPSASDQNTGSINTPWKTITKANNTLMAGDTVYIKAGTYDSYVAPVNSGTSSKHISYRHNKKLFIQRVQNIWNKMQGRQPGYL